MKITFLGTGEAFDENFLNNSSLVRTQKTNLLLDCGLSTPFQLWKFNNDQNLLDAVFISHTHADHYFGLPALLMRMWEEKRIKPLSIICLKENIKKIKQVMELGYKNFFKKYAFKINFVKADLDEFTIFNDLKLAFEDTEHSLRNIAIRIECQGKSVCYSGDGRFNKETEGLYNGCNLLIHEAYKYNEIAIGHGYMTAVINMAERRCIKQLALTHINRNLRKAGFEAKSDKVKILVPKPLDEIEI